MSVFRVLATIVLLLASSSIQAASIVLHWTAPGDDGRIGRASQYDLRYSTSVISDANWAQATKVTGLPAPLPAGNREWCIVRNLLPSTNYYFAIKAADERSNWSPLSNVIIRATCSGCIGTTGNVNFSADNRVDLLDLSFLVQFLTGNSGPQICFEEANIDGSPDGLITLIDLSRLTAYLTGSTALPKCP